MTQINETHVEAIVAACREKTEAIAESLNQCFDRNYRIEVGESSAWDAESIEGLNGPGLSVIFRNGTQGVLCLIPADLPLPEWYTAPGDSENARLQTLSLEWSMNVLPPELEAEETASIGSENLQQHVIDSEPAEWAGVLELLVYNATDEDASSAETADDAAAAKSSSDEADAETAETTVATPLARLYLIAAVEKPIVPQPDAEPAPAAVAASAQSAAQPSSAAASMPASYAPIDRQMQKLPVTVSVRLAEKKIELGQLAAITPGGLVTFNKGCESLLDLYVNNHLFGRGEAIKIGEKFGLKVTHVGVTPQQKKRVL